MLQVMLSAMLLAAVPVLAAEKTIEVERQHRDEPVLISRVTVGNFEPQCGLVDGLAGFQPVVPFDVTGDWLQNTTLYLLNRTDKKVAFVQLALVFPETGDGTAQKPITTFNITLGRIPAVAALSAKTGRVLRQPASAQALSFAPGQTFTIRLSDSLDSIRASFPAESYQSITRVAIRRVAIFFDDGMKWDGAFSVPDPNSPGRWSRVEGRYFPGTPTWPPK